jgi:hypothetical protein
MLQVTGLMGVGSLCYIPSAAVDVLQLLVEERGKNPAAARLMQSVKKVSGRIGVELS